MLTTTRGVVRSASPSTPSCRRHGTGGTPLLKQRPTVAERDRMDEAETDTVTRLKQACLDISNAAIALFDQIDEHGTEAPWVGTNVVTMKRLAESYDQIRSYFVVQAEMRL